MSNEILKLPDGQYVIWSTTTDGPVGWGDKETVTGYLQQIIEEDARRDIERRKNEIEGRFERADRNGTSSYVYGDEGETIGFEGRGEIKRSDLPAFLASYDGEEGADKFDMSFVIPREDDGPETPEEEAAREASGREAIRELVQSDEVQAHIRANEHWHIRTESQHASSPINILAGMPVMDEHVKIDILVDGPRLAERIEALGLTGLFGDKIKTHGEHPAPPIIGEQRGD